MEVDECLQKLRESIDHTKQNIIFEDNKNFGGMDGRFHAVSTGIDDDFWRFASDYLDTTHPWRIRQLTKVFRKIISDARDKLISVYHPKNLTDTREIQFMLLFNTMKFSLLDELRPIGKAIRSHPKAESCWSDNKHIICKMIEAAGVAVDNILKLESQKFAEDFDVIAGNMERLVVIVHSAYHKNCASFDESDEDIRTCVHNRVKRSKSVKL